MNVKESKIIELRISTKELLEMLGYWTGVEKITFADTYNYPEVGLEKGIVIRIST